MRTSCLFFGLSPTRVFVCACVVCMSAGANIIQWQMHPGAEIRWKIHKHGGPRQHLSHHHACRCGHVCHRRFVFVCVCQAITTQSNQSLRTENTSMRPAARATMVCDHALHPWCWPLQNINSNNKLFRDTRNEYSPMGQPGEILYAVDYPTGRRRWRTPPSPATTPSPSTREF